MKNLIFIPAYNNFDKDLPYGIKTWEFYCKKHNIELIVANKSIQYDFEDWGNGCWEPWFDKQLIDKDFDNILFVDCDTMVRWDAPNIFDNFKNDINVVRDAGGVHTGRFHLNQWVDINSNITTPPQDYFNTGFVLLNRDSYFKIKDKMFAFQRKTLKLRFYGEDMKKKGKEMWDKAKSEREENKKV